MELRCAAKKHGVLLEGVVEVKCDSRFCGAERGVTVLHRFNIATGELVETTRYKDPARKEQVNGTRHHPAAVRPA